MKINNIVSYMFPQEVILYGYMLGLRVNTGFFDTLIALVLSK
jgi:hypothetical protein